MWKTPQRPEDVGYRLILVPLGTDTKTISPWGALEQRGHHRQLRRGKQRGQEPFLQELLP